MEENVLLLSPGENVVKQYDFLSTETIADKEYEVKKSLAVTSNRVVLCVSKHSSYSQKELLLSDVDRIDCSHSTSRTVSYAKGKFLMSILLILAVFSLVFAVLAVSDSIGGCIALIILAILFAIGGFVVSRLKYTEHKALLIIAIHERGAAFPYIVLEEEFKDAEKAAQISREVGAILFADRVNASFDKNA